MFDEERDIAVVSKYISTEDLITAEGKKTYFSREHWQITFMECVK